MSDPDEYHCPNYDSTNLVSVQFTAIDAGLLECRSQLRSTSCSLGLGAFFVTRQSHSSLDELPRVESRLPVLRVESRLPVLSLGNVFETERQAKKASHDQYGRTGLGNCRRNYSEIVSSGICGRGERQSSSVRRNDKRITRISHFVGYTRC